MRSLLHTKYLMNIWKMMKTIENEEVLISELARNEVLYEAACYAEPEERRNQ